MAEPMSAERLARIREMCSSWSFIAEKRRHPAATFAIELLVERDRLAALVEKYQEALRYYAGYATGGGIARAALKEQP